MPVTHTADVEVKTAVTRLEWPLCELTGSISAPAPSRMRATNPSTIASCGVIPHFGTGLWTRAASGDLGCLIALGLPVAKRPTTLTPRERVPVRRNRHTFFSPPQAFHPKQLQRPRCRSVDQKGDPSNYRPNTEQAAGEQQRQHFRAVAGRRGRARWASAPLWMPPRSRVRGD